MHRIIIVLGWLVAATNTLGAQVALDRELLHLEKQIFKSPNDTVAASLRLAKFDMLLTHARYEEALLTANEIESKLISDSLERTEFLWNASLLFFLNGQLNKADFYHRRYNEETRDTSLADLEMRTLIASQMDTAQFARDIDSLMKIDSCFGAMRCYSHLVEHESGNSSFYVIASAILPGSGMIAAGYPMKGLTAMGLTAGSIWAISQLLQHALYINATAYFLLAGVRFYIGNLTLTDSLYHRRQEKRIAKEASMCKQHFDDLMKKYPIRFR
jgi:hypothetical protein